MTRRIWASLATAILTAGGLASAGGVVLAAVLLPAVWAIVWLRGQDTRPHWFDAAWAVVAGALGGWLYSAGSGTSPALAVMLGVLVAGIVGIGGAAAVHASRPGGTLPGRGTLLLTCWFAFPGVVTAAWVLASGGSSDVVARGRRDLATWWTDRIAACDAADPDSLEAIALGCSAEADWARIVAWVDSSIVSVGAAAYIAVAAATAASTVSLLRWVAPRLRLRLAPAPRLSQFELHWSIAYIVAAATMVSVAAWKLADGVVADLAVGIGVGVLLSVGAGFVAQGAALLQHGLEVSGVRTPVRIAIWIAVVVLYVASVPAFAAIGVAEQLVQLRRRHRDRSEPPPAAT